MALRWGMLRLSVQTNILSLDQQDTFQDTWESQEFGLSLLNLVIYLVDKCIRSFLSGMGSTLDKNDGCRALLKIVYNCIPLKYTLKIYSSEYQEKNHCLPINKTGKGRGKKNTLNLWSCSYPKGWGVSNCDHTSLGYFSMCEADLHSLRNPQNKLNVHS